MLDRNRESIRALALMNLNRLDEASEQLDRLLVNIPASPAC